MRQRRRHDRIGLSPVVQAPFGGEELERPLGLVPGRLGGGGLIPKPLGLTPQPIQRRAMTLTRLPLTAKLVEFLLSRVGAIEGTGGCAPGLPQRTLPFMERMEDIERIVEIREVSRATAAAFELDPVARAGTVVPDRRPKRRESSELLGPGDAITRLDHPTRHPAKAFGLDDHQDRLGTKTISSAVPCFTLGRVTSSSTASRSPAC